ncbi:Hypothetical protein D9617_4g001530 [Elsinoe fawcettii]|nr:Hypothetical protein D9617_4g001530 [Elsinoe fawcettii]
MKGLLAFFTLAAAFGATYAHHHRYGTCDKATNACNIEGATRPLFCDRHYKCEVNGHKCRARIHSPAFDHDSEPWTKHVKCCGF